MQTLSLKLPDDLMRKLTAEASARHLTRSQLVRESLERALFPEPARKATSCYDLARDLAGSVKGLPGDLADNETYMNGFGK